MLLRSVFSDFPARRMRAPARCMIPPRRGWRTAPIPPSGLRRDPRTFQQSAGLLEPAGTLTGRTCCSHPRWRTGCSFPEDWTKEKRPAFQQSVCVVRPTGFEPAAYRVGVIRPSKKKPRFYAGFRYIPQIQRPFAKTVEALGTPGIPRFFLFWGNSSQTVVRGRAEGKNQCRTIFGQ